MPNNSEGTQEHTYKEFDAQTRLYRLNEFNYKLKLKSSRDLYNTIKMKYGFNTFDFMEYKNIIKNRIGLKELIDSGIIDEFPILYTKDQLPVYHKIFTVCVDKKRCILF